MNTISPNVHPIQPGVVSGLPFPRIVAALNRISTNPTTFGSTASLEYDPPAGSFRAQVDSSPERNPPVAAGDDKVLKRFVDRESGVVFSALRKASGESVLPEEFKQIDCTPSLRLIIPQHIPTLEPTETSDLPSFTLVIPSPIEPHSPVVAPLPPPCTREEYLAAADAAPLTDRVPYFPRRCIHSLIPTSRCGTCELQLLACRIWYEHADRGTHSTLRAPRPYPAACNEAVRSIFFKLKIPFGEVDGSCVDQEMVDAISIMARGFRPPLKAVCGPSRIRTLFRRARRILSAPARVPMIPTPSVTSRRRVVIRS